MNPAADDYGLWGLAVLNTAIFVGLAYSFFKPASLRDWRSFGAYSAFIVALFAEMYGFPLTIYLFSGWLGARFPGVNLFGHDAGHLWWLATGQHGDPHFAPLHLLSFVFIFAGFALLSNAWHVLYHAQRDHHLATAGPYRRVRHPQYIGFVCIMFGFLLQWPTLLTLAMFPVLLVMCVRLARTQASLGACAVLAVLGWPCRTRDLDCDGGAGQLARLDSSWFTADLPLVRRSTPTRSTGTRHANTHARTPRPRDPCHA